MFTRRRFVSEAVPRFSERQDRTSEREAIVSTTVIEDAALTAADRCDRCGAQAYMRVTLASGFDLLFCAHHGKEHADKLRQVALKIHDESARIS